MKNGPGDRRVPALFCENLRARGAKSRAYGLVDVRAGLQQLTLQENLPAEYFLEKLDASVRRTLRHDDVVLPPFAGMCQVLLEGYFHAQRLRSIADRLTELEIMHGGHTFVVCSLAVFRNVTGSHWDNAYRLLQEDLIQRRVEIAGQARLRICHRG